MENIIQDRLKYLLNRYANQQVSQGKGMELFKLPESSSTKAIVMNLLVEMMSQENFEYTLFGY